MRPADGSWVVTTWFRTAQACWVGTVGTQTQTFTHKKFHSQASRCEAKLFSVHVPLTQSKTVDQSLPPLRNGVGRRLSCIFTVWAESAWSWGWARLAEWMKVDVAIQETDGLLVSPYGRSFALLPLPAFNSPVLEPKKNSNFKRTKKRT